MRHLHRIIEYGILLFVFLIPWQARWIIKGGEINNGYWEYGTASLYATEVLLGLILLGVIIKGAIWLRSNRSGFDWRRLFSPAGILLLFVAWSALSVFWSIDRGVAGQHLVFLVLAAALFVILNYGIPSPFKGEGRACPVPRNQFGAGFDAGVRVWNVIILSAAVQAAIALIQFFSQSIPSSTFFGMSAQSASTLGASVIETIDGRWLRAYGTFPHPNILGGWLVLGLILIIDKLRFTGYSFLSFPRKRESRPLNEEWMPDQVRHDKKVRFLYGIFIIILSALLTTFSRSAWLALGIGLLVYWFIGFRTKQSIAVVKIIAVTALTIVVFAALFPEPFLARLSSNNRLEIKSSQERAASLSQSWQIIKQYPLTGVGLGNYGLAVHRELDNAKPAWYYQPAHNVTLLIWSELGLIGLLLITYYLLLLWRQHYDSRFKTLILLPLAVLLFFDHYLWSLYSGLMMLAVWLSLQRHEP